MLLAYLLIFVLHLTASTCDATSRNDHLLFAGRVDDATAPSPAIHYHQQRHTAKVMSDYQNMHFHPASAMMARREWPPPRPSPSVVEAAGVGGAPPPPSLFAVEPSGIEGAPPPPGKLDTSAAMEPSPRGEGASSEEESASDDVGVDYAGPKTHPHGPPRPAESIN